LGKGYKWSTPYLVIKTGDYVKWSWAPPDLVPIKYKIEQVKDGASDDSIGFNSGDSVSSGMGSI
jgi:hypothetical protein